jgi:hypothetical protein
MQRKIDQQMRHFVLLAGEDDDGGELGGLLGYDEGCAG